MKQYFDPNETGPQRLRRLITGAIAVVLALLFCLWAGWIWIIPTLLIADYFFTKYINWGWGRNHPNAALRSIITIAGDVLYVVVAVSFIFTFFFQNFAIPTSSLEKTLLTGDYLFVTKHKYGPRLPMTPLGLPLVHNRLGDSETYMATPTLSYRRLAGTGEVERNDLVVFNFPAGDTVATSMTNPDYLTLCAMYGRQTVHADKATFGEIIYRPVDRRDHYVKRCIGLPGETIQVINTQVHINGAPIDNPSQLQLNYLVQTDGRQISKAQLDALEINYRDVITHEPWHLDADQQAIARSEYGLSPVDSLGYYGQIYEIPLTRTMVETLRSEPGVLNIQPMPHPADALLYPLGLDAGWSVDNYGPLTIPKRGMTIPMTRDNYIRYQRCIRAYEGHTLEERDGQYYIDGSVAISYTFAMDYYFMMGDNRHNSADSRAWGFVPEDHIVGQPAFIWLSLNDEQPLLSGGIRWKRMMRFINAD